MQRDRELLASTLRTLQRGLCAVVRHVTVASLNELGEGHERPVATAVTRRSKEHRWMPGDRWECAHGLQVGSARVRR